MSFYDYSVLRADGTARSMREFAGHVVLVVNTATGCGFTPQYENIVKIYNELHDSGFDVLDIPCNQFRSQAPGTDEEIAVFCQVHYGTPFEQMKKADVIGENALPLYRFLCQQKPFGGFSKSLKGLALAAAAKINNGKQGASDVQWNFTKFLISKDGRVLARFEPTDDMASVYTAIRMALKDGQTTSQ